MTTRELTAREFLDFVQDYCQSGVVCFRCPFADEVDNCIIGELSPREWDVDSILVALEAAKEEEEKMKAYMCAENDTGEWAIVFAKTAGQAKQSYSLDYDVDFVDVRAKRLPWADKFGAVDKIKITDLINEGYTPYCPNCERMLDIDTITRNGPAIYCTYCGAKIQKED